MHHKDDGHLEWSVEKSKGIAVDEDGIYIGRYERRIDVLDNDGNYLRTWGSYGSAMGQFIRFGV
jgi:hypothetical protein